MVKLPDHARHGMSPFFNGVHDLRFFFFFFFVSAAVALRQDLCPIATVVIAVMAHTQNLLLFVPFSSDLTLLVTRSRHERPTNIARMMPAKM